MATYEIGDASARTIHRALDFARRCDPTAPDINRLLRARPRPCRYGAPLGASNYDDAPPDARRYCQRVRFVDGDYGPDSTYWGSGGGPLYAVFTADLETLCYYRAPTRAAALEAHREATE